MLPIQARKVSKAGRISSYFSTLHMKAARFSETSVNYCRTTRRHVSKDNNLHSHHCKIKIYETIILPITLYERESRSLT
jgi:hypothetical protein